MGGGYHIYIYLQRERERGKTKSERERERKPRRKATRVGVPFRLVFYRSSGQFRMLGFGLGCLGLCKKDILRIKLRVQGFGVQGRASGFCKGLGYGV